jgi:integrase/recombinase XerD
VQTTQTHQTDGQVGKKRSNPRQQYAIWVICRDRWLAAKKRKNGSGHTRRAYTTAWEQFMSWIAAQDIEPWEVTPTEVRDWVQHMADVENLAPSTVNARLAALSSFYTFAGEWSGVTGDDGRGQSLFTGANPFKSVERPQVQPYCNLVYPTQSEVIRIVAALDLETPRGWRDRAIILGLLTMTQRFDAWLSVTWAQIHKGEGGWYFEYQAKGGHTCQAAIHEPVMHAVKEWLRRSDRWPLAPDDHLFVAQDPKRATRLPNVDQPTNGPLRNSTVNGILRTLAKKAGVNPQKAHTHALRHAGARWMREEGADVWDLQQALGYKRLSTTQIYVHEVLDGPENRFGAAIARQLSAF